RCAADRFLFFFQAEDGIRDRNVTGVQTCALPISGVVAISGVSQFLLQIALMVGLAVLLYGWLLTGQRASLHAMLLIGIIIGGGLGAVATFMQRLLTPASSTCSRLAYSGRWPMPTPTTCPWPSRWSLWPEPCCGSAAGV